MFVNGRLLSERSHVDHKLLMQIRNGHLNDAAAAARSGIDPSDAEFAKLSFIANKSFNSRKPSSTSTKSISKYNLLHSYFECNFSGEYSKRIAQELKRQIKSCNKYKQLEPTFIDSVRQKILYVHNYNMKVTEVTFTYPLSNEFIEMLIQYVLIESRALYRRHDSKIREASVQDRILRILMHIFNAHFESRMVPSKEIFEKSAKAIINMFIEMKRDYGMDNRLMENMTIKLLKKIGHFEKVFALKGKNLPCPLDTYLTDPVFSDIYKTTITSDYGTDDGLYVDDEVIKIVDDDDGDIVEVPANENNAIKEETPTTSLTKPVLTICLDDSDFDSDEETCCFTEEVKTSSKSLEYQRRQRQQAKDTFHQRNHRPMVEVKPEDVIKSDLFVDHNLTDTNSNSVNNDDVSHSKAGLISTETLVIDCDGSDDLIQSGTISSNIIEISDDEPEENPKIQKNVEIKTYGVNSSTYLGQRQTESGRNKSCSESHKLDSYLASVDSNTNTDVPIKSSNEEPKENSSLTMDDFESDLSEVFEVDPPVQPTCHMINDLVTHEQFPPQDEKIVEDASSNELVTHEQFPPQVEKNNEDVFIEESNIGEDESSRRKSEKIEYKPSSTDQCSHSNNRKHGIGENTKALVIVEDDSVNLKSSAMNRNECDEILHQTCSTNCFGGDGKLVEKSDVEIFQDISDVSSSVSKEEESNMVNVGVNNTSEKKEPEEIEYTPGERISENSFVENVEAISANSPGSVIEAGESIRGVVDTSSKKFEQITNMPNSTELSVDSEHNDNSDIEEFRNVENIKKSLFIAEEESGNLKSLARNQNKSDDILQELSSRKFSTGGDKLVEKSFVEILEDISDISDISGSLSEVKKSHMMNFDDSNSSKSNESEEIEYTQRFTDFSVDEEHKKSKEKNITETSTTTEPFSSTVEGVCLKQLSTELGSHDVPEETTIIDPPSTYQENFDTNKVARNVGDERNLKEINHLDEKFQEANHLQSPSKETNHSCSEVVNSNRSLAPTVSDSRISSNDSPVCISDVVLELNSKTLDLAEERIISKEGSFENVDKIESILLTDTDTTCTLDFHENEFNESDNIECAQDKIRKECELTLKQPETLGESLQLEEESIPSIGTDTRQNLKKLKLKVDGSEICKLDDSLECADIILPKDHNETVSVNDDSESPLRIVSERYIHEKSLEEALFVTEINKKSYEKVNRVGADPELSSGNKDSRSLLTSETQTDDDENSVDLVSSTESICYEIQDEVLYKTNKENEKNESQKMTSTITPVGKDNKTFSRKKVEQNDNEVALKEQIRCSFTQTNEGMCSSRVMPNKDEEIDDKDEQPMLVRNMVNDLSSLNSPSLESSEKIINGTEKTENLGTATKESAGMLDEVNAENIGLKEAEINRTEETSTSHPTETEINSTAQPSQILLKRNNVNKPENDFDDSIHHKVANANTDFEGLKEIEQFHDRSESSVFEVAAIDEAGKTLRSLEASANNTIPALYQQSATSEVNLDESQEIEQCHEKPESIFPGATTIDVTTDKTVTLDSRQKETEFSTDGIMSNKNEENNGMIAKMKISFHSAVLNESQEPREIHVNNTFDDRDARSLIEPLQVSVIVEESYNDEPQLEFHKDSEFVMEVEIRTEDTEHNVDLNLEADDTRPNVEVEHAISSKSSYSQNPTDQTERTVDSKLSDRKEVRRVEEVCIDSKLRQTSDFLIQEKLSSLSDGKQNLIHLSEEAKPEEHSACKRLNTLKVSDTIEEYRENEGVCSGYVDPKLCKQEYDFVELSNAVSSTGQSLQKKDVQVDHVLEFQSGYAVEVEVGMEDNLPRSDINSKDVVSDMSHQHQSYRLSDEHFKGREDSAIIGHNIKRHERLIENNLKTNFDQLQIVDDEEHRHVSAGVEDTKACDDEKSLQRIEENPDTLARVDETPHKPNEQLFVFPNESEVAIEVEIGSEAFVSDTDVKDMEEVLCDNHVDEQLMRSKKSFLSHQNHSEVNPVDSVSSFVQKNFEKPSNIESSCLDSQAIPVDIGQNLTSTLNDNLDGVFIHNDITIVPPGPFTCLDVLANVAANALRENAIEEKEQPLREKVIEEQKKPFKEKNIEKKQPLRRGRSSKSENEIVANSSESGRKKQPKSSPKGGRSRDKNKSAQVSKQTNKKNEVTKKSVKANVNNDIRITRSRYLRNTNENSDSGFKPHDFLLVENSIPPANKTYADRVVDIHFTSEDSNDSESNKLLIDEGASSKSKEVKSKLLDQSKQNEVSNIDQVLKVNAKSESITFKSLPDKEDNEMCRGISNTSVMVPFQECEVDHTNSNIFDEDTLDDNFHFCYIPNSKPSNYEMEVAFKLENENGASFPEKAKNVPVLRSSSASVECTSNASLEGNKPIRTKAERKSYNSPGLNPYIKIKKFDVSTPEGNVQIAKQSRSKRLDLEMMGNINKTFKGVESKKEKILKNSERNDTEPIEDNVPLAKLSENTAKNEENEKVVDYRELGDFDETPLADRIKKESHTESNLSVEVVKDGKKNTRMLRKSTKKGGNDKISSRSNIQVGIKDTLEKMTDDRNKLVNINICQGDQLPAESVFKSPATIEDKTTTENFKRSNSNYYTLPKLRRKSMSTESLSRSGNSETVAISSNIIKDGDKQCVPPPKLRAKASSHCEGFKEQNTNWKCKNTVSLTTEKLRKKLSEVVLPDTTEESQLKLNDSISKKCNITVAHENLPQELCGGNLAITAGETLTKFCETTTRLEIQTKPENVDHSFEEAMISSSDNIENKSVDMIEKSSVCANDDNSNQSVHNPQTNTGNECGVEKNPVISMEMKENPINTCQKKGSTVADVTDDQQEDQGKPTMPNDICSEMSSSIVTYEECDKKNMENKLEDAFQNGSLNGVCIERKKNVAVESSELLSKHSTDHTGAENSFELSSKDISSNSEQCNSLDESEKQASDYGRVDFPKVGNTSTDEFSVSPYMKYDNTDEKNEDVTITALKESSSSTMSNVSFELCKNKNEQSISSKDSELGDTTNHVIFKADNSVGTEECEKVQTDSTVNSRHTDGLLSRNEDILKRQSDVIEATAGGYALKSTSITRSTLNSRHTDGLLSRNEDLLKRQPEVIEATAGGYTLKSTSKTRMKKRKFCDVSPERPVQEKKQKYATLAKSKNNHSETSDECFNYSTQEFVSEKTQKSRIKNNDTADTKSIPPNRKLNKVLLIPLECFHKKRSPYVEESKKLQMKRAESDSKVINELSINTKTMNHAELSIKEKSADVRSRTKEPNTENCNKREKVELKEKQIPTSKKSRRLSTSNSHSGGKKSAVLKTEERPEEKFQLENISENLKSSRRKSFSKLKSPIHITADNDESSEDSGSKGTAITCSDHDKQLNEVILSGKNQALQGRMKRRSSLSSTDIAMDTEHRFENIDTDTKVGSGNMINERISTEAGSVDKMDTCLVSINPKTKNDSELSIKEKSANVRSQTEEKSTENCNKREKVELKEKQIPTTKMKKSRRLSTSNSHSGGKKSVVLKTEERPEEKFQLEHISENSKSSRRKSCSKLKSPIHITADNDESSEDSGSKGTAITCSDHDKQLNEVILTGKNQALQGRMKRRSSLSSTDIAMDTEHHFENIDTDTKVGSGNMINELISTGAGSVDKMDTCLVSNNPKTKYDSELSIKEKSTNVRSQTEETSTENCSKRGKVVLVEQSILTSKTKKSRLASTSNSLSGRKKSDVLKTEKRHQHEYSSEDSKSSRRKSCSQLKSPIHVVADNDKNSKASGSIGTVITCSDLIGEILSDTKKTHDEQLNEVISSCENFGSLSSTDIAMETEHQSENIDTEIKKGKNSNDEPISTEEESVDKMNACLVSINSKTKNDAELSIKKKSPDVRNQTETSTENCSKREKVVFLEQHIPTSKVKKSRLVLTSSSHPGGEKSVLFKSEDSERTDKKSDSRSKSPIHITADNDESSKDSGSKGTVSIYPDVSGQMKSETEKTNDKEVNEVILSCKNQASQERINQLRSVSYTNIATETEKQCENIETETKINEDDMKESIEVSSTSDIKLCLSPKSPYDIHEDIAEAETSEETLKNDENEAHTKSLNQSENQSTSDRKPNYEKVLTNSEIAITSSQEPQTESDRNLFELDNAAEISSEHDLEYISHGSYILNSPRRCSHPSDSENLTTIQKTESITLESDILCSNGDSPMERQEVCFKNEGASPSLDNINESKQDTKTSSIEEEEEASRLSEEKSCDSERIDVNNQVIYQNNKISCEKVQHDFKLEDEENASTHESLDKVGQVCLSVEKGSCCIEISHDAHLDMRESYCDPDSAKMISQDTQILQNITPHESKLISGENPCGYDSPDNVEVIGPGEKKNLAIHTSDGNVQNTKLDTYLPESSSYDQNDTDLFSTFIEADSISVSNEIELSHTVPEENLSTECICENEIINADNSLTTTDSRIITMLKMESEPTASDDKCSFDLISDFLKHERQTGDNEIYSKLPGQALCILKDPCINYPKVSIITSESNKLSDIKSEQISKNPPEEIHQHLSEMEIPIIRDVPETGLEIGETAVKKTDEPEELLKHSELLIKGRKRKPLVSPEPYSDHIKFKKSNMKELTIVIENSSVVTKTSPLSSSPRKREKKSIESVINHLKERDREHFNVIGSVKPSSTASVKSECGEVDFSSSPWLKSEEIPVIHSEVVVFCDQPAIISSLAQSSLPNDKKSLDGDFTEICENNFPIQEKSLEHSSPNIAQVVDCNLEIGTLNFLPPEEILKLENSEQSSNMQEESKTLNVSSSNHKEIAMKTPESRSAGTSNSSSVDVNVADTFRNLKNLTRFGNATFKVPSTSSFVHTTIESSHPNSNNAKLDFVETLPLEPIADNNTSFGIIIQPDSLSSESVSLPRNEELSKIERYMEYSGVSANKNATISDMPLNYHDISPSKISIGSTRTLDFISTQNYELNQNSKGQISRSNSFIANGPEPSNEMSDIIPVSKQAEYSPLTKITEIKVSYEGNNSDHSYFFTADPVMSVVADDDIFLNGISDASSKRVSNDNPLRDFDLSDDLSEFLNTKQDSEEKDSEEKDSVSNQNDDFKLRIDNDTITQNLVDLARSSKEIDKLYCLLDDISTENCAGPTQGTRSWDHIKEADPSPQKVINSPNYSSFLPHTHLLETDRSPQRDISQSDNHCETPTFNMSHNDLFNSFGVIPPEQQFCDPLSSRKSGALDPKNVSGTHTSDSKNECPTPCANMSDVGKICSTSVINTSDSKKDSSTDPDKVKKGKRSIIMKTEKRQKSVQIDMLPTRSYSRTKPAKWIKNPNQISKNVYKEAQPSSVDVQESKADPLNNSKEVVSTDNLLELSFTSRVPPEKATKTYPEVEPTKTDKVEEQAAQPTVKSQYLKFEVEDPVTEPPHKMLKLQTRKVNAGIPAIEKPQKMLKPSSNPAMHLHMKEKPLDVLNIGKTGSFSKVVELAEIGKSPQAHVKSSLNDDTKISFNTTNTTNKSKAPDTTPKTEAFVPSISEGVKSRKRTPTNLYSTKAYLEEAKGSSHSRPKRGKTVDSPGSVAEVVENKRCYSRNSSRTSQETTPEPIDPLRNRSRTVAKTSHDVHPKHAVVNYSIEQILSKDNEAANKRRSNEYAVENSRDRERRDFKRSASNTRDKPAEGKAVDHVPEDPFDRLLKQESVNPFFSHGKYAKEKEKNGPDSTYRIKERSYTNEKPHREREENKSKYATSHDQRARDRDFRGNYPKRHPNYQGLGGRDTHFRLSSSYYPSTGSNRQSSSRPSNRHSGSVSSRPSIPQHLQWVPIQHKPENFFSSTEEVAWAENLVKQGLLPPSDESSVQFFPKNNSRDK